MNHYISVLENWSVYVRPTAGLVGRDVVDALSRGSDEGSRKLVVGCFLSTWLWPSSNKPDSTPCCLFCLLLSSRSFPKNASWTWQHKALGKFSVFTLFFEHCQFTLLTNSHVAAGLTSVSTYLPQPLIPTSHLLSSTTCKCSSLLHWDIKSPMCCYFNN